MIKSELIEKLAAENTHLTHGEVERLVNVVLGKMTDSLAEGGRVELRGFGAFSVRVARRGRDVIRARARPSRCPPNACPSSRAARSCASG